MIAGIDIGGTTTQVVLLDETGTVVARSHASTPARVGGAAMAAVAGDLVDEVLAIAGAVEPLSGIGVGAAGVIDPVRGVVLAASDSFHDWIGFPLGMTLGDRFGVPVRVENDVNAFVLGELEHGAVRGTSDLVALTLGTGVGGAIVLGGSLYAGPNGAAGEIGHTTGYSGDRCTCGGTGHLETRASGRTVASRYAARAGGEARERALSAAEVADAARRGDPDAARIFEEAGRALGQAAVISSTMLDVSDILIGGGLTGAWDLLEPAIARAIAENPPVAGQRLVVHRGVLGTWAVALGAAVIAQRASAAAQAKEAATLAVTESTL